MAYGTLVIADAPPTPTDRVFGGDGIITDLVEQKALPTNLPLSRRVRLYEQRSGKLVAETWSDAATGAYSFANLNRSLKYTVLAYDHTSTYRAVIADNLSPSLMP